jgi:hypothetical protein
MRATSWITAQLSAFRFLVPVVVKELRQEIRMKAFDIFFVIPQIVSALFLLIWGASTTVGNQEGETLRNLYLFVLLLPLYGYLPLRAFVSISKDMNSGALELVSLSKISHWHLVAGKLTSLAIFGLLFVAAVAPYSILQYFTTRADIPATLAELYLAYLGSILICSVALASAPMRQKGGIGILVLLGLLFIVPMVLGVFIRSSTVSSLTSLVGSPTDFLVFTVLVVILILQQIQVASERLASPLEDFGLRKRVFISTSLLIFGAFLLLDFGQQELVIAAFVLFAIPVVAISLFEESSPMLAARIAAQGGSWRWFVKRGWLAGTTTALLFTSLVLLAWQVFMGLGTHHISLVAAIIQHGQLFCGLMVPWLLVQVLPTGTMRRQLFFYIIQALSLMLIGANRLVVGKLLLSTVGNYTIAGVLFNVGNFQEASAEFMVFQLVFLIPAIPFILVTLIRRHALTVKVAKSIV